MDGVLFKSGVQITSLFWAVGTGGARGARAPPNFGEHKNKIYLDFGLFACLFSVMHPLILAVCNGPGYGM